MSPALPVLIQIPVFLCAAKSPLYNFNFLQGLIPWLRPLILPHTALGRRTAATPDSAHRREAQLGSQPLSYTPRASLSPLAFKMPLPLPAEPPQRLGAGWVACPRERRWLSGRIPTRCCSSPSPPHTQIPFTLLSWVVLRNQNSSLSCMDFFFFRLVFKKESMGPCLPRVL